MDFGISPEALRQGLILYIVLVASLCIHEWAHAITAHRLGDHTPEQEGRVTLNPVVHMDLLGSVIFPLLCIFIIPGGLLFGWGKPVRINPSNFAHRTRDDILTTMAGPASNLVLALLAAVIGGLLVRSYPRIDELVQMVVAMNVLLAVFNLIPLPPLDGSHVLRHAVGMTEETFYGIARWSFLIIIVAINIPIFRALLGAAMNLVSWPIMLVYHAIAF